MRTWLEFFFNRQSLARKRLWLSLRITSFLSFLLGGCAVQGQPSTLSPQGLDALQVANLWWLMLIIAGIVIIVVTVLLLIASFRRSRGDLRPQLETSGGRRSLAWVLLGGAVVPAVALAVIMGVSISAQNAGNAEGAKDMPVIEVVGHQWWWEVRYPQNNFVTANEIHIPVGRPVMVKVTTADVIHSFWVPQLHPKIDMIPGQTNTIVLQANQPGAYRGECAEFCGTQHAKMDLVVIAQSDSDYNGWLAQQANPAPDPLPDSVEKQGQQAFLGSSCVYCHTIKGTNASGTLGPDLTHLASRETIGAGALPNTTANLAGWIMNSQTTKPGNKMPPMDLAPDQLQEILAYLQTLK